MKRCIIWILAAVYLLTYGATTVSAVTTTITSSPTTIGEDKFNVTVLISSASAGINYLRVDIYQEGTTKYFGETDNGQAWYSGSDGKQYPPFTILSNTPLLATVSAHLGDPSLSEYPGPGSFKLKVRRYTSSGSQGSEDVTPVSVQLTKTWPSPTPSPTAEPTPSPSPSPSPTPTPTPTPSPLPMPKPSLKPSPLPDMSLPPGGTVAGTTTQIDLSGFGNAPSPSLDPALRGQSLQGPTLNRTRAKTALIVGSGLLLVSLAAFFGYRRYRAIMAP